MRIPLKHPIQDGDVTIGAVTLRRAKARDMVTIADHLPALAKLAPKEKDGEVDASAMDGGVITAMIAVVSAIGDLSEDVAGELDFEDLTAIMEKATDFLSFGGSAGAGSSPTSPTS